MYIRWARGNGGRYRYFFCGRKQHHQCESRYIEGDAIETAIFSFYGTITFPSDLAAQLRQTIRETLDEQERSTKLMQKRLTTELQRLDKQEENLLDLASDGGLASDKIKQRLGAIQRQRGLSPQKWCTRPVGPGS